jgi:hypothetical protein
MKTGRDPIRAAIGKLEANVRKRFTKNNKNSSEMVLSQSFGLKTEAQNKKQISGNKFLNSLIPQISATNENWSVDDRGYEKLGQIS